MSTKKRPQVERLIKIFIIILFLASASAQPVLAQGVFGGSASPGGIFGRGGFGGVFRGIQKNLQDLFGGGKAPGLGGARLPAGPAAPIPTPNPANPPPLPNTADSVKVWLEWDALSVGPAETVKAGPNDPFWNDPNQLGRTHEQIIREEGCDCQPEPIYGEGCTYQEGSAKHVLYGWCGNTPNFIDPAVLNCPPDTDTCIPLCDRGRDKKGRCIPTKTPGPNNDTLPFAVSNKYLRRDGYTYRCIPEPCVARCPYTENYIEFQTEIYHSNDIQMEAVVENQSNHEVKNVEAQVNNLTYQKNKENEYGLPHNLDYPVKVLNANWPPIIKYEHGSQLTSGQTINAGGDAPLQIGQPITIGPFDLAQSGDPSGKDRKRFPLQMPESIRRAIPSSEEDPNTCVSGAPSPIPTPTGEPVPVPPGQTDPVPCECRAIYIHDAEGKFPPPINGWGCPDWAQYPPNKKGPLPIDQLPPNEVIEVCRLYYGINGGKYTPRADINGKICDRDCWTVPGCPPPWCYQGSTCGNTDYSACPNGAPISANPRSPGKTDKLMAKVKKLMPPQPAQAYGCGVVCIDEPKLGIKGQGGIALRDYEDLSGSSTNSYCKLREFKDVTELGGCGYEASSNNSVVGPIQIEVKYGPTQSSRSMLLASLPVGGQIIDDEARPFGWPASGRIKQDWGNTSQAQVEGDFRSQPNQLYTDYLLCPNQGKTYPEGRSRTGDWLHPGIDIEPLSSEEAETGVYSTQAGFVTFAGDAGAVQGGSGTPSVPARQESGTMIQIEADTNQDNTPDVATRYSHLEPGSLQFDVRWKKLPRAESSKVYEFGQGPYVARNQLLGLMGDSGNPGERKLRYDILYSAFPSADPTFWNCTSDPYILACLSNEIERFFFSRSKFESETVNAPVYKNP